jgi:nuclear GTP-binding protein
MRIDNLEGAGDYVGAVLKRVKPEYIRRTYGIASWTDAQDFVIQLAKKSGRLLKVCVDLVFFHKSPP